MKFAIGTLFLLSSLACACAEIAVPRIFSDNMVLQADSPLKFWGKSAEGARVEVSVNGSRFSTRADPRGFWSLRIPPQKANAVPQDIGLYENSTLSKTLKNVLIGEVWIAGGQSNMEYKLKNEKHGKSSNENADFPMVRFFVQHDRAAALSPQWDSPKGAGWQVCSPKTAWRFSAVGFYFARALFKDLNVPVGIVETPYAGSYMATWMAREDLEGLECFEGALRKFERENAGYDYEKERQAYAKKLGEYNSELKAVKAAGGDVKSVKKPGSPPIARGNMMSNPSLIYNAKIAPIVGFAARGVVWYQGEADAKDGPGAFAPRFEALIRSWRKYFENPDMPFCFVQLPSIDRKFWDSARLEQARVAGEMENVAMAVSIDLGEEKDVHPKDKLTIGGRLGDLALLKFYGRKSKADYPSLESAEFKGPKAFLRLKTPGSKIEIRGELRGFEVLVDGAWEVPQVKADGGGLLLSRPGGRIDAVRYLAKGWAAPDACVFNDRGLPLGPFQAFRGGADFK